MKINIFEEVSLSFPYQEIIDTIEKTITDDVIVSLIIVDEVTIHQMNATYRGVDRVTDVISFEEEDEEEPRYIGDIFLCAQKVKIQAESYQHSLTREFAFLVVHGILHLLGYDHMNSEDEIKMFTKQEELLNLMNYRR